MFGPELVVGFPLSLFSQVAVDVEVADGGVEFGLEAGAFLTRGFAVFGELFEARLLFVGFGDVAGDELFGFGGGGESFDVLAQARLVSGNLFGLGLDGAEARVHRGDAGLDFDEPFEGGAGEVHEDAGVHQRLALADGQLDCLSRLQRDAEAVEARALAVGFASLVGQLPSLVDGVLDVDDARAVGLVGEAVDFLGRAVVVGLEDAAADLDEERRRARSLFATPA
ncbi:MAG TPA: hypothetical protein VD861_12525 [Pyrinomonadaceae bacterium]|nr:hypothetical protein [Pyrinomonadaceae bacterium]